MEVFLEKAVFELRYKSRPDGSDGAVAERNKYV